MNLKKNIIGITFGALALFVMASSTSAMMEEEGAGYGGDAPACTMHANPDTIDYNGATTLTWTVNEAVVSGYLHPKGSTDWMQEVDLNGTWWISGIVDSRDYTLTVESADGQTADCDAHITVREEVGEELTCDMYANPATIAENGGTSLIWSSTGNVVSGYLHPTDSEHSFAEVGPNGSWWISGITDSRSYSVTLTDDEGNTVTCDAPITVEEEVAQAGECVDWDGDGWGWDGEKGCKMPDNDEEEATTPECIDWDGDGWGWDGEKGCKMP
jgi:hypothetical protein